MLLQLTYHFGGKNHHAIGLNVPSLEGLKNIQKVLYSTIDPDDMLLSMQERTNSDKSGLNQRRMGRGNASGFTILEVAIAGFVLALAVTSSLYALQMGFKMLETARNSALADQVLQSEIEDLRLKNYAWLVANYPARTQSYNLASQLPANVPQDMTLDLTVTSLYTETVTLKVTTTWTNSINKRKQSRSYQTTYSRNGISDYFASYHGS